MAKQTKVGKYIYMKSTRKDKKLMTKVNGKTVHFGAKGMEHYGDKTMLLPASQSHGDEGRRKNFISRISGIRKKDGKKAVDDPESPAYHAKRILW